MLKQLEKKFSRLILHQFKVDQAYPVQLAKSLHSVYFLIHLLVLFDLRISSHPLGQLAFNKILRPCWNIGVLVTLLTVFVYVLMLKFKSETDFQKKDKHFIPAVTLLVTCYPFLFFPALCQVHFLLMDMQANQLSENILGLVAIALGMVINYFGLTVMRNTMPSNSPFSVLDNSIEFWVYSGVQLTTAFSTMTRNSGSSTLRSTATVLCILSYTGLAVWIWAARFFKNFSVSKLYLSIHINFVFIKLLNDIVVLRQVNAKYTLWLPVIFIVSFRTSSILIDRERWIEIFNKNTSPYKRYLGIHIFEDLHFADFNNELDSKEDNRVYLYYRGQLERFVANKPEYQRFVALSPDNRILFYEFFLQYLESFADESIWHLKLILQFQIMSLMASMSYFRIRLARLQHLQESHMCARHEAYHYKILFQVKIDALYTMKVDNEINAEVSLGSLYWYMTTISEMNPDKSFIDVNSVLSFKNTYLRFVDKLIDCLEFQRASVRALENQQESYMDVLLERNKKIFTRHSELESMVSQLRRPRTSSLQAPSTTASCSPTTTKPRSS